MGAVYRKINMPPTAGHAILAVNQATVSSKKKVGRTVFPCVKSGSINRENSITPNKPTKGAKKVPSKIHFSNRVWGILAAGEAIIVTYIIVNTRLK